MKNTSNLRSYKTPRSGYQIGGGTYFRRVECIETGKQFESLTVAAQITGISIGAISVSARSDGEKKTRGLSFKYLE